MPISSLILSLDVSSAACDDAPTESELLQETLRTLRARPEVTVGPCVANRLAVVVETERAEDDRRIFEELEAIDGVQSVQIIFHDFSDVDWVYGTVPRRWSTAEGR